MIERRALETRHACGELLVTERYDVDSRGARVPDFEAGCFVDEHQIAGFDCECLAPLDGHLVIPGDDRQRVVVTSVAQQIARTGAHDRRIVSLPDADAIRQVEHRNIYVQIVPQRHEAHARPMACNEVVHEGHSIPRGNVLGRDSLHAVLTSRPTAKPDCMQGYSVPALDAKCRSAGLPSLP